MGSAAMATPQHGIFALGAVCHDYLEFDLAPHADFEAMVRAVAELEAIVSTTRGTNLVAGFAPGRWAALAPGDTPPGAAPFESVTGPDGFTMPSTQRDLWLWIASGERSNVFDMGAARPEGLPGGLDDASDQGLRVGWVCGQSMRCPIGVGIGSRFGLRPTSGPPAGH